MRWMVGLALGLAAAVASSAAAAPGFRQGGLDDALREAGDRVVMVDVAAAWCEPCQQLAAEVFVESGPGAPLLARTLPVAVDFDSDEGQAVTQRYGILGIPTVLFLRADGTELDRIADYEGAAAFVREATAILEGRRDTLAAAEAALRAAPDDPERMIALASALLMRRATDEAQAKRALALLERAVASDPDNARGHAGGATKVLGRWLVRVRRQYDEGARVLTQALARWGTTRDATALRYWAAIALRKGGDGGAALKLLREPIERDPRSAAAHALLADFVLLHGGDEAVGRRSAKHAAALDATKGWHHYLVGAYALAAGDTSSSREAVTRALALEPDNALYQRLLGDVKARLRE